MQLSAQDVLFTFLRATRWMPSAASEHQPTTWLEIYAFFRLSDGGQSVLNNTDILIEPSKFHELYHNLICDSKQIIKSNLRVQSPPHRPA